MGDKNVSVNGRKITLGDMRSRVTFQASSRSDDGQGGFTETWGNIFADATVWGYLTAVSSRERLYSEQMQYQRSHVLVIRYRTDITNDMRFTYRGRTFQVKGVRNPDERKYFLVIDAEENQGK